MTQPGILYLIPNRIAEGTEDHVIPFQTLESLRKLRFFLAEDVRTARRYLSSLKIFDSIETLQFSVLDKETKESELAELMIPLFNGNDFGVVSESGCPGVADPGALAVSYAHKKNVRVVPLVGPSSILLALMASGLNGQQFAFHGYLPIDSKKASRVIRELERDSKIRKQTQIFIETPFRNNALFQNLMSSLHSETTLCVALDLTSSNERIISKPIRDWKLCKVSLSKVPAVFLFLA
jgi:16S rRNA (cytidine1402-2'-O)-methyltransferase